MRIQYMSDLHFEFRENSRYIKQNRFPVTGDILILAGDIFYLRDRGISGNGHLKTIGRFLLFPGTMNITIIAM